MDSKTVIIILLAVAIILGILLWPGTYCHGAPTGLFGAEEMHCHSFLEAMTHSHLAKP
ncbi:MAG: hypothetical protein HY394_00710 [Candidatus Diapherotrites archaeon]|nr:hypothetical protein [Candidatus Diapherotrites archaeon]